MPSPAMVLAYLVLHQPVAALNLDSGPSWLRQLLTGTYCLMQAKQAAENTKQAARESADKVSVLLD